MTWRSDHSFHEVVEEVLSVSPVSASLERVPLLGEPSAGSSQLERPQEVVGFLEVGAHGVDLVDKVLNGLNAELAKVALDQVVSGEWDSLLVDLAVSSLVDELFDGFPRRITELLDKYPKVM